MDQPTQYQNRPETHNQMLLRREREREARAAEWARSIAPDDPFWCACLFRWFLSDPATDTDEERRPQ